eukprot:4541788-Pleurochrysis_carterae.AAC.2
MSHLKRNCTQQCEAASKVLSAQSRAVRAAPAGGALLAAAARQLGVRTGASPRPEQPHPQLEGVRARGEPAATRHACTLGLVDGAWQYRRADEGDLVSIQRARARGSKRSAWIDASREFRAAACQRARAPEWI